MICLSETDFSDPTHPVVKVKWAEDAETDWLPFISDRVGKHISWAPPCLGEPVTIISPSGELEQGRVFPGTYSEEFPAPSPDLAKTMRWIGENMKYMYCDDTKTLSLKIEGESKVSVSAKTVDVYADHFDVKTKTASVKNKSGELIEILTTALEIIANSKTPTMMGPQPSVEEAGKLPLIKQKLETFLGGEDVSGGN